MGLFGRRGVEIKTPEQIAVMREAGLVVARTLQAVREAVAPGVSTAELDSLAHDTIRAHGATSNFLGYGAGSGVQGFPGVICTSVNDEVVHGIPGPRVLRDGDVVSIDCGAIVDGWHGDSAITVAVGEAAPELTELIRVTEQAMLQGIAAARPGGRVTDIGHAVQTYVESQGSYGIVEGYTGHGIGTAMHQAPDVPNVGPAGRGPKLVPGIALAVEPMITLGGAATRTLDDDWTVVTTDGSWAAHFEHTFALTEDGPVVLTALG
ncbi:type I methionyl aminopeptidase [Aeromicrobium terrae]|jgi:methionyl aminopeptidase|uniref:Methionine aminopeptidase n=1 Tax=Aeromicrobium terrae TaxID=2498846 RepID=A0A5C8NH44_9ACTN|nr:type I methionyl aminopeptidase [Aeromicrobium terrae]TXL58069.1 type I methionyl aminopeptidase [Aeromicrobium terrae]